MSEMVEPKSGGRGCHLGHALNAKAAAKGRVMMKENPAYKNLKVKPKERNLPKGKGAEGSQQEEMEDMGKA